MFTLNKGTQGLPTMPPTLPIGCISTVRVNYDTGTGEECFNILHYQLKSVFVTATGLPAAIEPPAEKGLPALAESLATLWANVWKHFASNQLGVAGATAQKVYPGDRTSPYTFTAGAVTVGQIDSDVLPLQDAVTILKKTGYGQRWGLGRVYVPGIPELHADHGAINDTAAANLAGLVDLLDDVVGAADDTYSYNWQPVLTNVPAAGVPRVHDVTSAELSDKVIKTQRRRRPGKGA